MRALSRAVGMAFLPAFSLFGMVGSATAGPADHPILIRSLSSGTGPEPASEYLMLQMMVDGQQGVAGEALTSYGPTGSITGTYVIPFNVANGESHRTILLATPQRAAEGGFPTPDFILDTGDALQSPAGALCRTGDFPPDCVTWGAFSSIAAKSLPDPQGGNAQPERTLGRGILSNSPEPKPASPGCATWIDPADDSGFSNFDFSTFRIPPLPRNNFAPLASEETTCVPDTIFNETPSTPTNDTTPTLAFDGSPPDYGLFLECSFEGEPFHVCPSSGNTYGPLPDGTYNFQAKAIGQGGIDPTPASWTFEVDTVPPDTSITGIPPNPSSGFSATFSFASTEPKSKFSCQFESGPLQPCESPKTLFNLADGPHTFRVWASDQATNKAPSPAVHLFNVDTTLGDLFPPETTLLSRPPKRSTKPSASFTYRSSEPRSTFQCRLDDAPFEPCGSEGIVYPNLKNGSHSFRVRATDRAGNADPIPASHSWSVEAPLPRTTILAAPPGAQRIKGKRARVRFSFRSSKPGSEFRCRLDKGAFRSCGSTFKTRVRPGRHRFEVYAIDSLGNQEASPRRRIFRVLSKSGGGRFF